MIGPEQMLKQIDIAQATAAGTPVIRAEVHLLAHGAGQNSVGQRAIRHHPDLVVATIWKNFLLHAPIEHVPAVLDHVNPACLHAPLDLGELEIGKTDRTDLPLLDQLIERAHRLLERHVTVGPVNQIHVDVVGVEILETLLDRLHHPLAGAAAVVGGVRIADTKLGRDHYFLAARAERLGERLLRCTETVRFGRVETVDALINGAADGLDEFRLLDAAVAPAYLPAPDSDRRNLDSRFAKLPIFHRAASAGGTVYRPAPEDCRRFSRTSGPCVRLRPSSSIRMPRLRSRAAPACSPCRPG